MEIMVLKDYGAKEGRFITSVNLFLIGTISHQCEAKVAPKLHP